MRRCLHGVCTMLAALAIGAAPAQAAHQHHHRHHCLIGTAPVARVLHRAPPAHPAAAGLALTVEGPVEYVDEEPASPEAIAEWEAEQVRLAEEGNVPPAEVVEEHPTTTQEEAEAGEGVWWESVG